MPYKDVSRQREYQRQWQRNKRAGEVGKCKVQLISSPEQIQTASALLAILGALLKEVLEAKSGDIYLKARTCGPLIGVALRAIEVSDLESRLTALESKLGDGHEH